MQFQEGIKRRVLEEVQPDKAMGVFTLQEQIITQLLR
jgi:hypothetical protein